MTNHPIERETRGEPDLFRPLYVRPKTFERDDLDCAFRKVADQRYFHVKDLAKAMGAGDHWSHPGAVFVQRLRRDGAVYPIRHGWWLVEDHARRDVQPPVRPQHVALVTFGPAVKLRMRDTDRNPEGEDPRGLRAKHESGGPEGIAHTQSTIIGESA